MITQEQIISAGMLLIFLGFILIFFGSIFFGQKAETKYSVIGFIGPFPFGFGNDKRLMFYGLIIAITLIIIFTILFNLKR